MRDVRKRVRGEGLGVRRSATVVGLLIISILLPALSACAAEMALGDPRQMTFKPVEFTPPEPDRVVLENGMVVYLLEDQRRSAWLR
jgi:hypothetical protein